MAGRRAAGLAGLTGGVLALATAVAAGAPAAIEAAGVGVAVGALAFAAALGRTLLHLLRDSAVGHPSPVQTAP